MDNSTICMGSVNNNIGIKETLSKVPSQNDSLVFLFPENFSDETSIYQCSPNVPEEKDILSWLTLTDTYSPIESDSKVSNPVKCFPYVDYETASQTVCIDTRTYTRPKKRGLRNTDLDTHQYSDISMQLNTHMPEFYDFKLLDSESIIEYSLTSSYINELLPSTPLVTSRVNELISDQENGSHNTKAINNAHDYPNLGNVPSVFNNTHDLPNLGNVPSSALNITHELTYLDKVPSSDFNNTHDLPNPDNMPSAFNNYHDLSNSDNVPSSAFNITHDLAYLGKVASSTFNNTHDLPNSDIVPSVSAFNNTHDLPNSGNIPSAFNNTHDLPNSGNMPSAFNNTHDLPNSDNIPSAFNNTHDLPNSDNIPSAFNNTHDLPNSGNMPSAFNNTHDLPNSDNIPSAFNNTHDLPNSGNIPSAFNNTHDLPNSGNVPSTSTELPPTIITSKHRLEETYTNITSSESECEQMSTNSDSSGTFIKSNQDSSNEIQSDTFNRKSLKNNRQLTFDKDSPPLSPEPNILPVPDIGTNDNIPERPQSQLNVTFELNENVNFLNETYDFSQKFISTSNNEPINKKFSNGTFNKNELLSQTFTSALEPKFDEINNTSKVNVQSTPATKNDPLNFQTFSNLSPIRPLVDHDCISDHSDASSSDDRPNSSKSSISPAGSCDLLATGGANIKKTLPQLKLIPKNNIQPKSEANFFSRPLGLPKRGGASGLRPPSISVSRVNPVPDTIKGIPRLQRPSSSIPRPPSRIPAPRGRSHLPSGISQFIKRTTEK